jgi:hypothetical protein
MTAVMLAGDRVMGTQPPTRIVERVEETAALDPPDAVTSVLAAVAHVGMGAAAGGVYGLLPKGIPSALTLSAVVYTASYEGWVPAARILPPAHEDRPGRPAVMIAAHAAFGIVLALTERRLTPGRRGRRR